VSESVGAGRPSKKTAVVLLIVAVMAVVAGGLIRHVRSGTEYRAFPPWSSLIRWGT